MEHKKRCACTGIRSCLLCTTSINSPSLEPSYRNPVNGKCISQSLKEIDQVMLIQEHSTAKDVRPNNSACKIGLHVFCLRCRCSHLGGLKDELEATKPLHVKTDDFNATLYPYRPLDLYLCRDHSQSLTIKGISIIENFISKEEETNLIKSINLYPWKLSQSGRRKQDFGPKANFKKKKVTLGNFSGLPSCSQFLVQRMKHFEILKTFEPVEVCHLEYNPMRGSSIDPHKDDEWLWGERLVTLHLSSGSFLTLTNDKFEGLKLKVPMPARSLLILSSEARYDWKHAVDREDVSDVRIAVTFRELTTLFTKGGELEIDGQKIRDAAQCFDGKPQYRGPSQDFTHN